jgi:hypothetical protein
MRKKCDYEDCNSGIRYYGNLKFLCEVCYDSKKCDNCDGSGKVHSHNPECWECDGRGWVKGNDN